MTVICSTYQWSCYLSHQWPIVVIFSFVRWKYALRFIRCDCRLRYTSFMLRFLLTFLCHVQKMLFNRCWRSFIYSHVAQWSFDFIASSLHYRLQLLNQVTIINVTYHWYLIFLSPKSICLVALEIYHTSSDKQFDQLGIDAYCGVFKPHLQQFQPQQIGFAPCWLV